MDGIQIEQMESYEKDLLLSEERNEFMLSPVPMEKRRPTFSQVMVWVGFGYVVTGLFVGGTLAGYGNKPGLAPNDAFLAIVLGMGSLFIITSLLGIIAQRTGLNLALVSRYSYGSKGFILPMFLMAAMTLGWFASIVGMVGDIWGAFIGNPTGITIFTPEQYGFSGIAPITLEVFLSCVLWGIIFTYTAVKGIKAIEKLAKPVAPTILAIALVMGFVMIKEAGGGQAFLAQANKLGGLGLGTGVTALVGSWIAGAVMGVDLFRFNKNISAVWLGSAACFIFTNPLLNIVGYIGSVSMSEYNYVVWMLRQSVLLAIIGVFAWTVSLWTTDCSELYCNSLYLGPALTALGVRNIVRSRLVACVGTIGSIIGSLALYQMFFADFINILGAIAPPVCAPILADYFIISREKYDIRLLEKHPAFRWAGVISFIVGGAFGYLFQYVWKLPGDLPSGLVAMLIAFVLYIILYRMTPDKEADKRLIELLKS